MKEKQSILKKLKIQKVQPKGGTNIYTSAGNTGVDQLPEDATFFQKFFNESSYQEKSFSKRINAAYQFSDTYADELFALTQAGTEPATGALKDQAMRSAQAKLSRTGKNFALPLSDVKEVVENNDFFVQTRGFWNEVTNNVSLFDTSNPSSSEIKRQNIFVKGVAEELSTAISKGQIDAEYRGKEVRRYRSPLSSPKGEVTYFNIESKDVFSKKFMTDIFGDEEKGTSLSKSLLNLDSYFNNIGGTFDQTTLAEIRSNITKQSAPFGAMPETIVRPGLIDSSTKEQIVDMAFRAAQGDDANIISTIPGKVLHGAASDGTLQNHRYANNLTSNNSKFFKRVTKQHEQRAKKTVSTKSLNQVFDSFEDSQQVLEPIKRAEQSLREMNEGISRTQKIYGFNGNQKIIKETNHKQRIKGLTETFQQKGYNVAIDYSEDSEGLVFSFAKKGGVDLGNMNLIEKMQNENIGRVMLPLEDSNYTTNVHGTKVHSSLFMQFDGDIDLTNRQANKFKLNRASSVLYDELERLPDIIRGQEGSGRGKRMTQGEIYKGAVSSYKNTALKKLTPADYSGVDVGSGYKTSSRDKNFLASSSVDASQYIEEFYKKNYSESYERFDAHRKKLGLPNLTFLEDRSFMDGDWVNPKTGARDAMGLQMDVVSQGMMRFNEMYGSEQLGLELRSYGLNANMVRGGSFQIGDYRRGTPLGEMNRATREQILKTQNYMPMQRDKMGEHLLEYYGEEGKRYLNPVRGIHSENIELGALEDNHLSIGMGRTLYTEDMEIAKALPKAEKAMRQRISEIDSELSTTSDEGRKLKLLSEKRSLTAGIDELKLASVYEDQTIVRQSWADSAQVKTEFQKALDKGYELPEELLSELRESQPELFDEAGRIKAGSYDVNIGHNDLERLGLKDRRNRVTVGTLNREYSERKGYSDSDEISRQSQLFYNGSSINKIIVDKDGNTSLGITQRQVIDSGTKIVDSYSGERTTAVVLQNQTYDFLQDAMGAPGNTSFIRQHINIGRGPQGGMINTLVNTGYYNSMADVGNVLIENADGSFSVDPTKATTGAVRKWAENVSDVSGGRTAYERDFLEKEFIPSLSASGYTDMVVLGEGSRIAINDTHVINKGLEGLKGKDYVQANKQRFDNLYDYAVGELGYDPRYAQSGFSMHDVTRWQGEKGPRYADREGRILSMITSKHLGDESALSGQISRMRDTTSAAKHREFAKDVIENLKVFQEAGQDIREYQRGHNVIFDFTGNFSGEGNMARQIAQDGSEYFVVDGYSIPRSKSASGLKTGSETIHTLDDLMSIELGGLEGFDKTYTVQDLVKDSKSQAVMQLPEGEYSKNILPVYSHLEENYELNSHLHQRGMNVGQSNVTNALMEAMEIQRDKKAGSLNYQRAIVERGIVEMESGGNKYMTGKGKSDFIKSQFNLENKHGFSGVLGGYNTEHNFLKESEFGVSREMARAAIEGNEDNILSANSITHINGQAIKDMTGEAGANEKRLFILDKITGASSEDDEFQLMSSLNRFPTQSQGSIQFGSVRIDDALKGTDRIMIGRMVAEATGADFDGDTAYLLADYYTEMRKDGNRTDFMKVQQDMIKLSDINKEQIKEAGKIPLPESFSYVKDSTIADNDIYNLFQSFDNRTEEALDLMAKSTQVPGIGYVDNEVVAGRGLVVDTFRSMYESGALGEGEEARRTMIDWIDRYDKGADQLVQGYIGAKKLTPDILDIFDSDGALVQSFGDMDRPEQLDRVATVMGERSVLPASLYQMTPDTIDDVLGSWLDASAIGQSELPKFKEYMMPLAIANEATKDNGSSRNLALKLGRSYGTNTLDVLDAIENNPMDIIGTEEVQKLGNLYFGEGSEVMENFASSQVERKNQVAASAANLIRRNSNREGVTSTSEISSSIMHNLNIAEGMQDMSQTARRVTSQNEAFNTAKSFVSNTANSTAFKVGAGAAAMWMISSSLRDGPTPEGNEAQQEASQAEVNPSALLTSPTARVTPNAENVNLMISGRGNIDQSAVAGLVNNEINGMIGSQMEMNVNVTDNTRRLDRSFYEKQVNSVLGI